MIAESARADADDSTQPSGFHIGPGLIGNGGICLNPQEWLKGEVPPAPLPGAISFSVPELRLEISPTLEGKVALQPRGLVQGGQSRFDKKHS